MLICPQCQFENPDENRFCQECGTSLTQQTCQECGTKVEFGTQTCPTCGAVTGGVWWAILTLQEAPSTADSSVGLETGETEYFDSHKRYRLLKWLPSDSMGSPLERQARVVDCQPFQLSPLETLLRQQAASDELPAGESEGEEGALSKSFQSLGIPAIVEPYILLQAQFHQALPILHDAWEEAEKSVLLLEDRTGFPLLADRWSDAEVPPLQILHWLHEMVELWAALEPWQCRQSLLNLSNLRLDEDHVVCLQRLYQEQSGASFSLQQLGDLWNDLFSRTQRTQIGSIALLIHDLQTGALATLEEVQMRVQTIAYEFQSQEMASKLEQALEDEIPLVIRATPIETSSQPAREASPPLDSMKEGSSPVDELTLSFEEDDEDDDNDDDRDEGDDIPTIVLPMQLYSLEDAGRTDVGRQRDHNEDFFGVQTELHKVDTPSGRSVRARGLYILCDGMGGHAGGEVASALAVNTLKQYFQDTWLAYPVMEDGKLIRPMGNAALPSEESIREAIYLANKAIYDENQLNARSGSGRMGTTLVLVLLQDTRVAVAHVGDSRLYCVSRRRGLEQITSDHDVGQREIQRGVEPTIAYARPDAFQLTQALGPRDENFVNPDVHFLDLNEDTLLLLCSDGLTDSDLVETHWRTHLESLLSSQTNLERGVSQLIDLANQYNGHDNITAVAIRLKVRPNLEMMKMKQG
ncbi:MAG: serine/threonine phosphatase [Leptolyngbyaceae cyanobacterium bins.59]|nr:serine/threonine phosphatase [Leptolyngbyaceae cyanobacterium bins.59]